MSSRVLLGLLPLCLSFAAAQYTERPLLVRPPQIQTPVTQPAAAPVAAPRPAVKPAVTKPAGVKPSTPKSAAPVRPAAQGTGRVVPSGVRPVTLALPSQKTFVGGVRPVPFAPAKVNPAQVRQVLSGQAILVRPRSTVPFNPLNLPQTVLALDW